MGLPAATANAVRVPAGKLRRAALAAQGLLKQSPFGRGRNATRAAIEQLGYVQIDTISVVTRAHHHVLHSRVPNYRPDHLDHLQRQGAIFEYWYHAAAYLPMGDYRFALPHMQGIRDGSERWIRSRDTKLMKNVLARVAAEGPLMARDFAAAGSGGKGWWDWKPAKRALEQLFMQGDLMVTGRQGFQKVYDLTERVLPAGTDTRMPSHQEMAAHLLEATLRAHGHVTPRVITYQRRGPALRAALKEILEERVAEGSLVRVLEPGGGLAYADARLLDTRSPPAPPRALLLSPFDNLVIHRERVRALFGLDYQLECYFREADRRFGYFCLPILYRDSLVGRADCKAHRRQGRFQVVHLHLETQAADRDEAFLPALAAAIRRFAGFNGCQDIQVSRVSPAAPAAALRRVLQAG